MNMAYVNVITDPKQWYEQYLRKELNVFDALERGYHRSETLKTIYLWEKMSFTSVFLLIFALSAMWSIGGDCCSIGYDQFIIFFNLITYLSKHLIFYALYSGC